MKRGVLILSCILGFGCCVIGCDDDTTAGRSDGGRDMRAACAFGVECCPLPEDPVTGEPTGSCSVEGTQCQPNASDTICTCAASSWQCRSALSLDMARHD